MLVDFKVVTRREARRPGEGAVQYGRVFNGFHDVSIVRLFDLRLPHSPGRHALDIRKYFFTKRMA